MPLKVRSEVYEMIYYAIGLIIINIHFTNCRTKACSHCCFAINWVDNNIPSSRVRFVRNKVTVYTDRVAARRGYSGGVASGTSYVPSQSADSCDM